MTNFADMKSIASLFIFSLALFICGSSSAQDAKSILDKLSSKAKGYETIEASYESTLEDKQAGVNLSQSGSIKIKGEKYHLDLPDYKVISDGETVWTYEKESNTVYIDYLEDVAEDGFNPNDMFRIWETGFKHELKELITEDNQEVYWINLYPKDPGEKPFHTIQMYVDKGKMEVKRIKVMNRDGSTVSYKVKDFTVNKSMNSGVFGFEKSAYPGVDIIDNRI